MLPWSAFPCLPGLNGVPSVWRRHLGQQFEGFKRAFLVPRAEFAQSFPCSKCGCSHDVTVHAPNDIIAVCACDSWNCDDLLLTPADIQILELSWPRLGRALCKAFGLEAKPAKLPFDNTRQIGSWSTDAVPVILTIQHERADFRNVVMGVAARLRQKFILLAPTSANLDALSQEILAGIGAGFFALDSHVRLTEHGHLQATSPPGELFARFRPEPREPMDEDVARRAFAVIHALDCGPRTKAPSVLAVFRFYCIEELSVAQTALRCRCSRLTIIRRLNFIRATTGADPKNLRRLSPHLEKIAEDVSDSRARGISRKAAT